LENINSTLENPKILFDISLLFNFNSADILNFLFPIYSSMNPNKGLIIFFSYESLDPSVIIKLSKIIPKDFHISFSGFFNDIENQYIDNSVICFSW
jgi:hypothetical protein